MNAIIIAIIVFTILQVVVCKFSLWWLIALVCRLLFACRIVGATIKVKNLCIGEAVAFGAMFIFNMMFSGDSFPWLKLFLFLLMSAICCFLMFLDDILYVYVIEDDED